MRSLLSVRHVWLRRIGARRRNFKRGTALQLGPDSMTNAVDDWLGGSSLLQGLEVPAIPQQALDLRAEEQDGQKGKLQLACFLPCSAL